MRLSTAVLLVLLGVPAWGDELAGDEPPPQPRDAGQRRSGDEPPPRPRDAGQRRSGDKRAARSYVLTSSRPGPVAAGAPGTVTVTIRCEPGVHVQRQAPLRATASASPGLALAKARLGWEDARDVGDGPAVEIPVSFRASAAGAAEVRLRLVFFVCSSAWCVRQDREVVIPVVVSADGEAAADARR